MARRLTSRFTSTRFARSWTVTAAAAVLCATGLTQTALTQTALAQTPTGQQPSQSTSSSSSRSTSDRSANRDDAARGNARQSGPQQGVDPSSTRGRPDADYPNKSAQDTRTDAAARAHSDEGHDDASDRDAVSATPSAGPTGRKDTGPAGQKDRYAGAEGRKRNVETACSTPTDAAPKGRASSAATEADMEECEGGKHQGRPMREKDSPSSKPQPGATAPMHR